jgi:hypothetical protein
MPINFADLFASLEIMWKGMIGLFAVCGFITLLIIFISKITASKTRKDEA